MTFRSASHRQRGFTLLEVMLAMTALAMLTAIIYGAFNLGVRAVEKGQLVVVGAQRARAASDVMRRQLKSMVPYPCRPDEDSDPVPYFEVGQNPPSLSFITAAGLHGGAGMEHVRYEVRGDPPQLVLMDSPVFWFLKGRCSDVVTRDTTEAVLLDGFRTITFEPQAYESDTKWSEGDGVEEFGLPRSIHISVEGLPGASSTALGSGEVPVVANLASEDGWRAFEQFFAGGEETTIPGETPEDEQQAGAPDASAGGEGGADSEDAADPDDPEDPDGGDE